MKTKYIPCSVQRPTSRPETPVNSGIQRVLPPYKCEQTFLNALKFSQLRKRIPNTNCSPDRTACVHIGIMQKPVLQSVKILGVHICTGVKRSETLTSKGMQKRTVPFLLNTPYSGKIKPAIGLPNSHNQSNES